MLVARERLVLCELRGKVQNHIRLLNIHCVGIDVVPLLKYLISNAPDENRRVVAVAFDEIFEVALVPFVEVGGVVELGFAFAPNVGEIGHYDESHLVAEVEQLGGGCVVRGADAVAAHCFQHLKLPLDGAFVNGGAKAAKVVVVAHSADFQWFAVQNESLLAVEFKLPHAKTGTHGIGLVAVLHDAHPRGVKRRRIGAPKCWFADS